MPVKSSTSSVIRWPDKATVAAAAQRWAAAEATRRPGLRRLGYFGSYAVGNWGVGSDLDLVAVVDDDARPFVERGRDWDLTARSSTSLLWSSGISNCCRAWRFLKSHQTPHDRFA